MKGTLYLIPSSIGEQEIDYTIPKKVIDIIHAIDIYIVENERTARRYLIKAGIKKPIDALKFYTLNKHTRNSEMNEFLQPAENSNNIGLLSEAGLPCIADPGAQIVALAHRKNIKVVPLVGPSSILLAMAASGLNGQNFAFNGYLPIKNPLRTRAIKKLEKRSLDEDQSQIFMETPYRNMSLLKDLIAVCHPMTKLCIASDITGRNEMIKTISIKEWKNKLPEINKIPAIFILQR